MGLPLLVFYCLVGTFYFNMKEETALFFYEHSSDSHLYHLEEGKNSCIFVINGSNDKTTTNFKYLFPVDLFILQFLNIKLLNKP